MDESPAQDRIEQLVEEEHRLLSAGAGQGRDPERHARLEAIQIELDSCWDALRRRRAGQGAVLDDAEVPAPPNDLDGREPEPLHLEHGVHENEPAPDPGINPNVP